MSEPVFVSALANSAVGSVAMMLVMTTAPFAAIDRDDGLNAGASIIQCQLVGMFAPSFVVVRHPRLVRLVRSKPTASGRATRRASSDPACNLLEMA